MENVVVVLGVLTFPLLVSRLINNFWGATILCTVCLSILLHVAAWVGAGYVDPFYRLSIPISLVIFFIWSAGALWAIRRVRDGKRNRSDTL